MDDEAWKQECYERWQARRKERREQAVAFLAGQLHEGMVEHQWEWYDIMGEVAVIRREREESQRAHAAAQAARARREASQP